MLTRDRGTIVQIGSALAYRAIPLQSAYGGAKHAMQGFTESLRSELIHDGSNVRITMVQLPAVNTPQFRWVKSRLPNEAQPVPPIYQPEVAAEAIFYAAHHDRRQFVLGFQNALIIGLNKLAPGIGDRYLAMTGYKSQQTDQPRDRDRPHNLWEPVPGDQGAHGVFDDRSKETSWQLWANMHSRTLALLTAALAGAIFTIARRKSE